VRLGILGLLILVFAGALSAQTAPAPASPDTPAPILPAVPYTDKEFPSWVLKVRRAEIIAVGAFPLTYLLAGLGYDLTYYLGNGFPKANIPWPAGPGTSQWTVANQPELLQRKNLTLVGIAVGTSLLVAGLDWVLGW